MAFCKPTVTPNPAISAPAIVIGKDSAEIDLPTQINEVAKSDVLTPNTIGGTEVGLIAAPADIAPVTTYDCSGSTSFTAVAKAEFPKLCGD